MDKVISYEQIQGFIESIRNLQKGYVTNFFGDPIKHNYWIKTGALFFSGSENCYILLYKKNVLCHLFYIAINMKAVEEAINLILFETDCVIDIVSKNDYPEEVLKLATVGFKPYKQLFRMSHIGTLADKSWEIQDGVEYGQNDEAQQIYDTLQIGFDPFSEQLPTINEIEDYIQRQQLLVIKDKETLCGFLIFTLSGKTTWYLRYWYTNPEYRDQKIGSRLLKSSLAIGKSTKRQQLWVVSDNENAIKRYKHYGFSKESMINYVLIKRKNKQDNHIKI